MNDAHSAIDSGGGLAPRLPVLPPVAVVAAACFPSSSSKHPTRVLACVPSVEHTAGGDEEGDGRGGRSTVEHAS
jgi:hypothetical protein